MTRPSRKTDDKLVAAAIAMLPKTGFSGLKMRAVAGKAKVNLGMFHYHFKNKEAFIERVAAELYERFFQTFTLEVETGADSGERLQNAIKNLARFARDNRSLLLALMRDVMDGNQQLVRLLESFIPRHGIVILKLLRECQKQGTISNLPLPVIIPYMIGSMIGPVFLTALLEQVRLRQPYDFLKKFAVPLILSDTSLDKRLTFAFRGIASQVTQELVDKKWEQQVDRFVKDLEREQKRMGQR
ncbi:TetR family transcriptional regulator [bacterium]|nr:TetR family transcriptional regulator [bacterium]